MAGGIQQPFRLGFQADLLHSGSISFGRFESESLSWERRSSFSHNRYLEDVEKCSKPGSVTEMKAYFEAHFRRKALQKKSSSESQDGKEFQIIKNDDPQDLRDLQNGNDIKHFTFSDESPCSSGHSKHDEEMDIQKRAKENVETLCSENGNASCDVTNFDVSLHGHTESSSEHLELKETENVVLVKSEVHIEEAINEKDDDSGNSASQQTFFSKVRPTSETKQSKSKLKAHIKSAQAQRSISGEASYGSGKTKTREIKGLLIKEKEKQSPRPASPIPNFGRRATKLEESSMSFPKAKAIPINKSIVKEYRSGKTSEVKSLPAAHQNVNRTKHAVTTQSQLYTNQNAAGFIYKSDQRAERQKEIKRAAEMTQSRKSVNFKATPMPSFYKASSRSSDENKVISTNKTPSRPRTGSITPHTIKYLSNSNASLNPKPGSSISLTNKTRPLESPRSVHNKKKESEFTTTNRTTG
uniref:protein WVD2-like 7 n=1 Tax=Erigeron canadensis TaxID=72917 RepID=UPI001CB99817|nr:protein WVD2-like 7 [Erigeron canadensis]XP_043613550.1 protein WVD2-like 7 [Erigeron canadensis]